MDNPLDNAPGSMSYYFLDKSIDKNLQTWSYSHHGKDEQCHIQPKRQRQRQRLYIKCRKQYNNYRDL